MTKLISCYSFYLAFCAGMVCRCAITLIPIRNRQLPGRLPPPLVFRGLCTQTHGLFKPAFLKFTVFPLKTHAISWLTFTQAAFHLQSVSGSQQRTLEKLEKATMDAPKRQKTNPIPAERPVPGCVHLPSGACRTEACPLSFGHLCGALGLFATCSPSKTLLRVLAAENPPPMQPPGSETHFERLFAYGGHALRCSRSQGGCSKLPFLRDGLSVSTLV